MKEIRIAPNIVLPVTPEDNETVKEIDRYLPLMSMVFTWGEEIYFDINLVAPYEKATLDVRAGDLAYWPKGKSLCIFFGPTPISDTDKPVPSGKVVIVGKVEFDREELRRIREGVEVVVR